MVPVAAGEVVVTFGGVSGEELTTLSGFDELLVGMADLEGWFIGGTP